MSTRTDGRMVPKVVNNEVRSYTLQCFASGQRSSEELYIEACVILCIIKFAWLKIDAGGNQGGRETII